MNTNKINSRTLFPKRKHAAVFINLILILTLLAQPIAPLFAQSSDEAPPSDPADRVVETWQDDDHYSDTDDTPTPQVPPLQLTASADNLTGLIPEGFSFLTATPDEKDQQEIILSTQEGVSLTLTTETAAVGVTGTAVSFFDERVMLILDTRVVP